MTIRTTMVGLCALALVACSGGSAHPDDENDAGTGDVDGGTTNASDASTRQTDGDAATTTCSNDGSDKVAAGIYRHSFNGYYPTSTIMLLPADTGCITCYDDEDKHDITWPVGELWRSRWSADRSRIYIDWYHADGKVRLGDDESFYIDMKDGTLAFGPKFYPIAPRDYHSYAFSCGGKGMPEPAK